jgi:Tol biopolymer transport system component
VAVTSGTAGPPNVYSVAISGHAEPKRLTNSQSTEIVVDWSTDGRYILYAAQPNDIASVTKSGLWVLPVETGTPLLYLETAYRQAHGQFSPDSQWISYTSTESGKPEIYVQSFPGGHGKWKISAAGGDYPRWRKDGRELFYVGPDQTLMSVAVQHMAGGLNLASPQPLFKISLPQSGNASLPGYPYDVASDGQRILGFTPSADTEAQTLIVMSNWQAELRQASSAESHR